MYNARPQNMPTFWHDLLCLVVARDRRISPVFLGIILLEVGKLCSYLWIPSQTLGQTFDCPVTVSEATMKNMVKITWLKRELWYYRLWIYRGCIWYDSAQHNNYNDKTSVKLDGRAMGCLSRVIRWKMTAMYRKHTVLTEDQKAQHNCVYIWWDTQYMYQFS